MGSALGGLGRLLSACTSEDSSTLGRQNPYARGSGTPPTDGDEFVPPNGAPPTYAGDAPPVVPNAAWEARARQLEDEQRRVFANVPAFTMAAPGVWAGKERSHVPQVTKTVEAGLTKVVVLIQHVMGSNGLDAGVVDAGYVDAAVDAARDGGGGGGGGGGDGGGGGRADAGVDAGADAGGTSAPVHYITTIYLRALVGGKDTVVGLWEFVSTDPAPPSVKFTLPKDVTEVTAYEWCTLHGLWKADPLAV